MEVINKGQFSALEGKAVIDYKMVDTKIIQIDHTGVDESLRGQGVARELTEFMLEYVKANNFLVIPLCPYTKDYFEKHPELDYLLFKK